MERIALAERYFQLVEDGSKTSTIRYKHRDYQLGEAEFYCDLCGKTATVIIGDVQYKTFGELTEADAKTDGFTSLGELKLELLGFYPNCKDDDEITKVVFKRA